MRVRILASVEEICRRVTACLGYVVLKKFSTSLNVNPSGRWRITRRTTNRIPTFPPKPADIGARSGLGCVADTAGARPFAICSTASMCRRDSSYSLLAPANFCSASFLSCAVSTCMPMIITTGGTQGKREGNRGTQGGTLLEDLLVRVERAGRIIRPQLICDPLPAFSAFRFPPAPCEVRSAPPPPPARGDSAWLPPSAS